MGRLIKNHWARLIVLVAATIQIGGSIQGIFWPKVTWDFTTDVLDFLVEPIPLLQITNVALGCIVMAWEWPLDMISGSMLHRSIHARLVMYPICAVSAIFLYQSHTSAIYYALGLYGYMLALCEHETINPEPWNSNPKRIVDCERERQNIFPRNLKRNLECLKTDEEKPSTNGSSLTQLPSNQSLAFKLSARFELPAVHQPRAFSDFGRKRDSSKVYRRTKAKTWHPEIVDDDEFNYT